MNASLNIGIVLYPTFGGSGVVATELGMALAKKGHQVHFISYSQPVRLDRFVQNVFYHEVNIPAYPLFEYHPYETALTSKIVNVALHEKLDLLHVHYAIPHASAAIMAKNILADKGMSLPLVCTLHGTDITLVGKDSSYKPVINYSINHCDIVTAVSDSLKRDTYKHFEVSKAIRVIYNFIDVALYRPSQQDCIRKFAAPNDEKIIMHVSNFRPVKRIPDIIRAFAIIREQVSSRLVLIGDGPDRQTVEDLASELGVADDVLFLGKLKSTENILHCADLFVLASEAESFGVSALEAMASGVPVISSDVGGVPEVQKHGETGFLFPIGDFETLARQSILLLKDPLLHARCSRAAKERAGLFDIHTILPQYENLYYDLLKLR
ncbi:MAG: N-acetyl-alpha-D-glucosaminyl L-malate synthase BshA [Candidatus Competibacteraceae bacterium]|nr:N-acetyl-alpha-D-glucosaminyl L-malate synthase BshA [Candidatus Competibacteraceae bacterium]